MSGATAPPRTSQAVSLAAAVVSLATSAIAGLSAVPGIAALALLAHGTVRGTPATVRLGGAGLLGVAVVGGVVGESVGVALLSAPAAVVAWDVAEHGVRLGEQVGRDAVTRRPQVLHATATVVVVTGTAYGVHLLYRSAGTGTASPFAVALLLGGAFALAAALWLGS